MIANVICVVGFVVKALVGSDDGGAACEVSSLKGDASLFSSLRCYYGHPSIYSSFFVLFSIVLFCLYIFLMISGFSLCECSFKH